MQNDDILRLISPVPSLGILTLIGLYPKQTVYLISCVVTLKLRCNVLHAVYNSQERPQLEYASAVCRDSNHKKWIPTLRLHKVM